MAELIIKDLAEAKALGKEASIRIQGGFSLDPSVPDVPGVPGANPGGDVIPLFDPFPSYDVEKFRNEILKRIYAESSTPEPYPLGPTIIDGEHLAL